MDKVIFTIVASFFLVGLWLGWALGYQAARGENVNSVVDEFEDGDGI